MQKYNKLVESISDILKNIEIDVPWLESRGRKPKYKFNHLLPGQIIRIDCDPARARNIQTAIKFAAKNQAVKIETQNKKHFIKIRRIK